MWCACMKKGLGVRRFCLDGVFVCSDLGDGVTGCSGECLVWYKFNGADCSVKNVCRVRLDCQCGLFLESGC